jgi:hypothetical protein
MVFGTGGTPRDYLDPNFLNKLSSHLQVTPDIARQFQLIKQDLVSQFQRNVEATSVQFITFLQQAENPSDAQILQNMQTAQGKIDFHFENLLQDTTSRLLQQFGDSYKGAIDQFVHEMRQEIAPKTQLEAKLRQDPELNKKLPPRSVFELSPTTPSSLDKYLKSMSKWRDSYPAGSVQNAVGKRACEVIQQLINEGKTSLTDVIAAINQFVINSPNQKWDIYISGNIKPADLKGMSDALDGKLNLSLTQMDKNYLRCQNWINRSFVDTDKALAHTVMNEIKQLGSSDSNLNILKQWAEELTKTPHAADLYYNAPQQGQLAFAEITQYHPHPNPL